MENSLNILIGGEAGAGLVTIGELLAKAWYGAVFPSWSPRAISRDARGQLIPI